MKKSIISGFIIILIMMALGVVIYDSKVQNENLLKVDNNIKNIILLNKDFDVYLKTPFVYDNFDIIQSKIISFKSEINNIHNNSILKNIEEEKLNKILNTLKNSMDKKFMVINRIKSYRAILNNSFRIIQKIHNNGISDKLEALYTVVMTIDKNPELNLVNLNNEIKNYNIKELNRNNKYFIRHAQIIFEYLLKFNELSNDLDILKINEKLDSLYTIYSKYASNSVQKAQIAIGILFVLLFIVVVLYLLDEYKLSLSNRELFRFRRTLEDSDNIVIITDANQYIKYVNRAFVEVTGYSEKELIGQKPSILKSGQQSNEFYKDMNETIYSGNSWNGEFINKNKDGSLSYTKGSISPVFDEDGNIYEFIAIKIDITNEILIEKKLYENEKLLMQQSKMAAMGEMLENIAHQWRQPLSTISTASSGLQLQKELGIPTTKEEDTEVLDKINQTAQYLSETINNFRDFFKTNKEKTTFNLKDTYFKTLRLINSKFASLEIEVVETLNDIEINNLENEIVQVMMNLLNNAKDVLATRENQRRIIFVNIYKDKNDAIIEIIDNGGGIPEDIIDKVFEPYFTTKHKAQGTGIGLYMSLEMTTKHMNGILSVENDTYEYESKTYSGAKFTIKIPLN